jgi:hypothetical protein
MEKFDKRVSQDRRKQATPALSSFTLWGQRMTFRREEDKKKGGYVDRYSSELLFLLIWVVGLNVLDVLFTMMILDNGGWEVNPVVRAVIEVYGDGFLAWKFTIVSVPLILLCLHSKFRRVLTVIFGISVFMTIVVLYQIYLMIYQ